MVRSGEVGGDGTNGGPVTEAEAERWVSVPAASGQASVRLLCLPHAGSGAAVFFRWRRMLPAEIAICPVMLPGRETRLSEPLRTSLDELVGEVREAVRVLGLDQAPLAVFGHSMGALLGFELARRLEVEALFVSGREAPEVLDRQGRLHELGDEEFLNGVRRRYGVIADGLLDDPELRAVFLPILRADLTVVETYEFKPGLQLRCDMQALAGEDDRSVSDAGLANWRSFTRGRFVARRLPGDHFYQTGAGRDALLTILERSLSSGRW